jgi:hypothetical protein
VRKAKQCLDQGELKDFEEDLDYYMETLSSANASINLKCLRLVFEFLSRSFLLQYDQVDQKKRCVPIPSVFKNKTSYFSEATCLFERLSREPSM